MWDYDKLFAEGNIVGISPTKNEVINLICSKSSHNIDGFRNLYSNNDLSYKNIKIQYIIRLDEHGNVIEKLFDRERDMAKPMPELETGMFVLVLGSGFGFVDAEHNRIIYKNGGYDFIDEEWEGKGVASKIIEVYNTNTFGFDCCNNDTLVWRSPEYQTHIDSKF